MKTTKDIRIFLFLVAGVLVAIAFFFLERDPVNDVSEPRVLIGEGEYVVRIADTPIERTRGLSGTEYMGEDEGMLFIFNDNALRKFWMKDMHFPLDIIWITEDLRVGHITENATPDSYEKEIPDTFSSEVPVKYVLEVSAFEAEKRGIIEETKVELFLD